MKQKRKMIFLILMAIVIVSMFLPVASFKDNTAQTLVKTIEDKQSELKGQADQLERWKAGGKKKPEQIEKQEKKVQGLQDELNALIEKQEEATENANDISYSLLPAPLPINDFPARYGAQKNAAYDAKQGLKKLEEKINKNNEEKTKLQKTLEYATLIQGLDETVETVKITTDKGEEEIAVSDLKTMILEELSAAQKLTAQADEAIEPDPAEGGEEGAEEGAAEDAAPAEEAAEATNEEGTAEEGAEETAEEPVEEAQPEVVFDAEKIIADLNTKIVELDDNIKNYQDKIEPQKALIEEEQAKLDAMEPEHEALNPEELQIDNSVINNYKLYQTNKQGFNVLVWVIFAAFVATVLLVILAGNKEISKLYTIASFTHLAGILMLCYTLVRLTAFPIKLPYGNATLNIPVTIILLAGSIIAFAIHVQGVHNSKRSMIYVFCSFLSLLALVPFWIMMVNATRSSSAIQNGVSLIPGNYMSYNWNVLASKNFDIKIGFMNTAIIAFGSTIFSVFFSAMTAYGFKVYQFKGNKILYAVVLATIMIPGQVTGTGFFMFMYQIGLVDNRWALIVPAIAAASTVFFFRQYLEANLQLSLVEAARIDGCGEFRTFCRIIVPIMIPAMATMGIMAVIGSWNNYLTPLMLFQKPGLKTLPMMVQELRGDIYRTEYGSIYLGLTLTALPLIIVYFALSKYIIAGVALGGVKE